MAEAPERALLAVIHGRGWPVDDDAQELGELARSAGAAVVGTVVQRRGRYEPATLFSPGKVEEIREQMAASDAAMVLCNRDLSPRQQLHLERALRTKVIDRTRLILDIFAARARSREGRIQVELAQCMYLLPRLGSLVEEMGRTGAGIGTRGPGETQLESDRRRVRDHLSALRAQLRAVSRTREEQRRARPEDLAVVALVGYTNAGKSTLHRALTGSDVLVEDALFATLDPTIRVLRLPDNRRALLCDTVGFIHDLPHHLVAAFRATLESVTEADLLLEVVDASDPRCWEQRAAVEGVLEELDALRLPRLLVWNKIDAAAPPVRPAPGSPEDGAPASADTIAWDDGVPLAPGAAGPHGEREAPPPRTDLPVVHVSALDGTGIETLRALIAARLPHGRVEVRLRLPFAAEPLVAAARRDGEVLRLSYDAEGIALAARCAPALAARLRAAATPDGSGPGAGTDHPPAEIVADHGSADRP